MTAAVALSSLVVGDLIDDMTSDFGATPIMTNHVKTFLNSKTGGTAYHTWTNTNTATSNTFTKAVTANNQTIYITGSSADYSIKNKPSGQYLKVDKNGRLIVEAGDRLVLPDGTEIIVDLNGNYVINDQDAKVIYKANRSLEFNRYINASDLLEEFLVYLKSMGVKRKDIMKIDLGIFITWLIVAAAEADGMDKPEEEVLMLEHQVKPITAQPKCMCCKRFIPKKTANAGIFFCSGVHMDRYRERIAA